MSTYVMRWNPSISSSKIEAFREACAKWPDGFCGNWSIYEWQEAQYGDSYVMVRVGDGPNGIVYHGRFLSDPYEGEDWGGSDRKRYYVDISILDSADPDEPCVGIDLLEAAMPDIVWRKGHSGEKLTPEQEARLASILPFDL